MKMKMLVVIPHLSFEIVGANVRLRADVPHFAVEAINQPDYKERKLVFVFQDADAAYDYLHNQCNRSILLDGGCYSLIS